MLCYRRVFSYRCIFIIYLHLLSVSPSPMPRQSLCPLDGLTPTLRSHIHAWLYVSIWDLRTKNERKAQYFSFWNWFNSLTVIISSCMLFPGKSITFFFMCLPGKFWLDARYCKYFLFAYYVLLDSDKYLQLCSRITAKPLGNHWLSLETDSRRTAFYVSKIVAVLLLALGVWPGCFIQEKNPVSFSRVRPLNVFVWNWSA